VMRSGAQGHHGPSAPGSGQIAVSAPRAGDVMSRRAGR
jgi:hypothetical protein